MPKICFIILLFICCGVLSIFAQEKEEEQKLRQEREIGFLQKILADAETLRRPENRAYIYAKVGSALWQADEKFARKLFQDSINELTAAQNELQENQDAQRVFQNLIYGQSPRWEILFLIAARDAEFALDAMMKSRPAKISGEIAESSEKKQTRGRQFSVTEIQNEQRLIGMAADQNPERAVKLLRESIKKDFNYQTVNMLRKLFQKDAALANQLAGEIGQQFLKKDLGDNYERISNLSYFLSVFLMQRERQTEPKDFQIPEKLIYDLALKMLDINLNPNLSNSYSNHSNNLEYFEKTFPDRYAKLKQKNERQYNHTPQQKEYSKLMQSSASPDELLSQAEKFPRDMRRELYRQAAQKFAASGNLEQAQEIFNENFSEEETGRYMSEYAYNLALKTISEGKIEQAFGLANQIPDKQRKISILISIASAVFNKNPEENKNQAISILEQARALLPETPESQNDLNSLINLANQFASIEPERAFSIIEQLIAPLDELSQANAVLAKYRGHENFRLGEFQVGAGQFSSLGISGFENSLNMLKEKDFDRVLRIINSFSRFDLRVSLLNNLSDGGNIINLPLNSRTFINYFGVQ